jgi:pimeloyl-ACP methyl ester carboxylesterase
MTCQFSVLLTLALLSGSALAAHSIPLEMQDGVTLDATYYSARKPGPGLLFLNMCDPSRDQTEWRVAATELAEQGYHVLTFDYRGFGESGGEMPMNLASVAEAMPFWRESWMSDVQAAYDTLVAQEGVDQENIGVAGASCGVFMGLEFAIANRNVKSLVFLGGPTDAAQREHLSAMDDIPILLISGDERGANELLGTLEWSDQVFAVSNHPDTQIIKYKTVTHGTKIFEHHPVTERMVIDWFVATIPVKP